MMRRLATAALLACGLVLGCGKSNDPPTEGGGDGYVPKDEVRRGWKEGDRSKKTVTTRNP